MTVRFAIRLDGAVGDACVQESSLEHAEAVRCMLEEFRTLRFPPAQRKTTVVYPIVFAPE